MAYIYIYMGSLMYNGYFSSNEKLYNNSGYYLPKDMNLNRDFNNDLTLKV